MNSTAFSLLANNNAEIDENQEMELTIKSLSIFIGPSGSSHLSDLTKQDPSASEPETVAMMEYSEGSSSEVNSPVSSGEVQKGKIAEDDEAMENFNVGVQLKDLMICLDNISDKSTDTWKTGLELSEDGDSIFSRFNSNIDKQCQVLAIVGDNSEEFDKNNNPVLNPVNIDREANHLAEGQIAKSLTTREKIRLSVDEWRIIREAVEHGMPIPSNSSKDMLLGYHYALRQQAKQLAKKKIEIQQRKESAIPASNAARRARSDASHTNARRNH
jgi:archaellin